MKNLLIILFIIILTGCSYDEEQGQRAVARVYDKSLYLDELSGIIPENSSRADSAAIADGYVKEWVKKQLLLKKAELNLTKEEKDVDNQLDEYRALLLIYKYENEYIKQKLDTLITEQQMDDYYKLHASEFRLTEPAVKGFIGIIPKDDNSIEKLRSWYRSSNEDVLNQFEDYIVKHEGKFNNFNDEWVLLRTFFGNIPFKSSNSEELLLRAKTMETRDSSFVYFLRADAYKPATDTMPINLAKNELKDILINKRKNEMLNKLHNNLLNDALNHNHLIIYKDSTN